MATTMSTAVPEPEETKTVPTPTRRVYFEHNLSKQLPGKAWTSHKTLLLTSIVHVMAKDADAELKIDWGIVSSKLRFCVTPKDRQFWNFSAAECESRYLEMLQIVEEHQPKKTTAFEKREYLIETIARGLLLASQDREKEIISRYKKMISRFQTISAISDTDTEKLQQVSDGEMSDSETDVAPRQAEELLKTQYHFIDQFATCFQVSNPVFEALPDELTEDVFSQDFSGPGPSIHLNDGEVVAQLIVSDDNPFPEPVQPTIPIDNIESAVAVSSKLSSLVRMAIRDAGDEDEGSNKGVSPTGAPTLSKLLELPPRDRSQPLPQINSLMTSANAEKGSESGSSPRGSPIKHESPTKLLAALGTTASPVNLLLTPIGGVARVLPMVTTPLKSQSMDEMEIANDFVIESGVLSSDSEYEYFEVDAAHAETQTSFSSPKKSSELSSEKSAELTPESKKRNAANTEEATRSGDVPDIYYFMQRHRVSQTESTIKKESEFKKSIDGVAIKSETCTVEQPIRISPSKTLPEMEVTKQEEAQITRDGAVVENDSNGDPTPRISPRKVLPETEDTNKAAGAQITEEAAEATKVETELNSEQTLKVSPSKIRQELEETNKSGLPITGEVEGVTAANLSLSESRDDGEEDNSNSGTDTSVKKRLTRRSMKNLTPGESSDSKDEIVPKDGRGRHSKIMSRLKSAHEDTGASEKDDSAEGKRVTRARAKTASPTRARAKSISLSEHVHVKGESETEAKASAEQEPGTPRATRSRAVVTPSILGGRESPAELINPTSPATSIINNSKEFRGKTDSPTRGGRKSVSLSKNASGKSETATETSAEQEASAIRATRSRAVVTPSTPGVTKSPADLNPSSPASSMTNTNKEEDDKSLKKAMLSLINRVGQHKHAFMFSKSILTEDLVAQGYSQKIKRPLDIPTIKRNIETGVIKSFGQLERDITLMLMNLVMFNHVTGIPPAKVFGMNAEMSVDCMAMFEEFRVSLKLPKLIPEASKQEESDEEPEPEPLEEVKSKYVTPSKSVGRKRRNRSISSSGNTEETPETKRRTLRTSTAAATTATSAWHARKKLPTSSPDIASLSSRGRTD